MYSLTTLDRLNKEAAAEAKARKLKLFIPASKEDCTMEKARIPTFGDHRPKGWELVETHFVDKFGIDRTGPAKDLRKFVADLVVGHGYAVIEEGQFQVMVGEFVKK